MRKVTISTGGALTLAWELTPDQMFDLNDLLVDRFGTPQLTVDGEQVDLEEILRAHRLGSIGEPKRTITVEPVTQPEKAPEPITVPAEPEKVPA